MPSKQQIIVIHGGMTFDTPAAYIAFLNSLTIDLTSLKIKKDWKDTLQGDLGDTFDVLQPRMPNATNAQYEEWCIVFSKIFEQVEENIILVGHSLGAIFLAKYLSENTPSKRIKSLLLIAAPFGNTPTESLGSFLVSVDYIPSIQEKVGAIHLFHSTDDAVVPFSESQKYKALLPHATLHTFEDRGHFNQPAFPELLDVFR